MNDEDLRKVLSGIIDVLHELLTMEDRTTEALLKLAEWLDEEQSEKET